MHEKRYLCIPNRHGTLLALLEVTDSRALFLSKSAPAPVWVCAWWMRIFGFDVCRELEKFIILFPRQAEITN